MSAVAGRYNQRLDRAGSARRAPDIYPLAVTGRCGLALAVSSKKVALLEGVVSFAGALLLRFVAEDAVVLLVL